VRAHDPPNPPSLKGWSGDRSALFGGPVATSILVCIGVLGWTFEALCVAVTDGHDRVVVKKSLRALELQGILQGCRPRGPGFNVRLVTVADAFAARDELNGLLRACAHAWPDVAQRVRWAADNLSPRTKEHFRRRGLSVLWAGDDGVEPVSRDSHGRDGRRECLGRYYALTRKAGRTLSSADVNRTDSNLYRSIRLHWGAFRGFREEAGLPPVMTGKTQSPNPRLRQDCIAEYFALARDISFLPNTADLNRLDGWLSQRIRMQWGGFPAFCEDLKIYPARRHRSSKIDDATRRDNCRHEYRELMQTLGRAPSSWELRLHTAGLYKRIHALWGSFERFCDDIGLVPPRRRSGSYPGGHPQWVTTRPADGRSQSPESR